MSNSLTELTKVIGQPAKLVLEKLTLDVTILDAKVSYGNLRYLVSPVSGAGTQWVDVGRVQINSEVQS